MKCLSCGVEKDLDRLETYPYEGEHDHLTRDHPIPPLLVVECQGRQDKPDGSWDFKAAIMCHECWHRLSDNAQGIDMWIGQSCWETLNPVTPFVSLPEVVEENKWEVKSYF